MSNYAYDPELADMVPLLPTVIDWSDIGVARANMEKMILDAAPGDPPADAVRFEDNLIPGAAGDPDVRVRVYRPTEAITPSPALLYIHGGGFCFGSIETEHLGAGAAAISTNAVTVSVDYRLAPEHPFPAGAEDCYAALVWMADNAFDLGIDTERVAVTGSSAGGGLSAAVALMARDRKGPCLCFQALGIPELDDRLDTPSMRAFTDTPLWNRPNAEMSWRCYLGEGGAEVSAYAAPARAESLAGLPPAYVSTMEFDPLRDEGILYALRMLSDGVAVELHQYPGTFHGSSLVTSAEVSKRSGAELVAAIRRALHGPT
jgi:acetyl esterase/lipase